MSYQSEYTGDQIDELLEKIPELEESIKNLETRVTNSESRCNSINDSLNRAYNTLDTKITELKTQLNADISMKFGQVSAQYSSLSSALSSLITNKLGTLTEFTGGDGFTVGSGTTHTPPTFAAGINDVEKRLHSQYLYFRSAINTLRDYHELEPLSDSGNGNTDGPSI